MSAESKEQKAAFDFLCEKCNSQELFTKQQFQKATGYSYVTFRTYWSKQFKGLLIQHGTDHFRVSLAFRQFAAWPKFRDGVVTQNRILTRQYKPTCYEDVLMFEFFMPLRNEEYLRAALDALFFRDSIEIRLKTIPSSELQAYLPSKSGENRESHLQRVCAWVADRFVGYSIGHVSGRFRAGELKTRQQVAEEAAKKYGRYLVDETTAIVRFIFPGTEAKAGQLALAAGIPTESDQTVLQERAKLIRWVFYKLFVQSILEVVNGEDEVWLLESGLRTRLHIFRAAD